MTSVSIIIPYYNQGKYLQSAVQSALASFDGSLEVLVVNDGSTEAHVGHYCDQAEKIDPRVRVIHKENGGLSSARNSGLREAKGAYIQFLDCDDVLLPGKITRQISQLIASGGKLVSVCGYYISDEYLADVKNKSHSIDRFPFTLESFLFKWERGFTIPIHCGLFHRSVFSDLTFEEELHGKEDWLMWTALAHRYSQGIMYCPFVGAIYRLHQNSMTRSLDTMGESWLQACQILRAQHSARFPEFVRASDDWHQKFYKGCKLSGVEKHERAHRQRVVNKDFKGISHIASSVPAAKLVREIKPATDAAPLISFVVPVFNHGAYLKTCIESIVRQNTKIAFEVIAIDDVSTEAGVIDSLCAIDSGPVAYKVFQNDSNYGISVTQNLAVERCKGEYIAFVDCDDYLTASAVNQIADAILESSADYIFTDRNHVDKHGNHICRADYGGYSWISPSGSVENDVLLGMVASHLKVIRRQFYTQLSGSDADYSGVQDWDFALRTIGAGRFHYLNRALYNHRLHTVSVSSSGAVTQLWMTNVLRRKYFEKHSNQKNTSCVIELSDINTNNLRYMSDKFRDGVRYTYRTNTQSLPAEQINMLREFNSFFDRIIVSSADASSLMGYLWDHKAVQPF